MNNCGSCFYKEKNCKYEKFRKSVENDIFHGDMIEIFELNCSRYKHKSNDYMNKCNECKHHYVATDDEDKDHILCALGSNCVETAKTEEELCEDEKDYLLAKERLKTFDPSESISREEMMKKSGITQQDLDSISDKDVEFE